MRWLNPCSTIPVGPARYVAAHFRSFVDFTEIENVKYTRKTKFSLSYGRGYAIIFYLVGNELSSRWRSFLESSLASSLAPPLFGFSQDPFPLGPERNRGPT